METAGTNQTDDFLAGLMALNKNLFAGSHKFIYRTCPGDNYAVPGKTPRDKTFVKF